MTKERALCLQEKCKIERKRLMSDAVEKPLLNNFISLSSFGLFIYFLFISFSSHLFQDGEGTFAARHSLTGLTTPTEGIIIKGKKESVKSQKT